MDTLKVIFDRIQDELLKITSTYSKKIQIIDEILSESDIRWLNDKIKDRVEELAKLIRVELTQDDKELRATAELETLLKDFAQIMSQERAQDIFEWLNKRTPDERWEEDMSELKRVIYYDQIVREELEKLKKKLLEQIGRVNKILKAYDFKQLLALFDMIVHSELESYIGYHFHNPEEDFTEHGLYLNIKGASESLITMCNLLKDESSLSTASAEENKQAIDFVKVIIQYVEQNKISTVIFLDKSGRPFSYAFLLMYKQRHLINRPKIFNIDWSSRRLNIWSEIKNSRYHTNEFSEAYEANDFKKVREILMAKEVFYANLFKNCGGKNVLIVDDLIETRHSVNSLKEFIETLFAANKVYVYSFAYNFSKDRDIPAFTEMHNSLAVQHKWIKSLAGIGLVSTGRGYVSTAFTEYPQYAAQFQYLRQKFEAAKRHIELAVQKYG